MLVSKSTKLTKLTSNAQQQGNQRLIRERKYLATQTKQCNEQGYTNLISHARELLLCYTSKKVTSKLHKLTSYKSNYTSTMYMKVITSLCNEDANQREE